MGGGVGKSGEQSEAPEAQSNSGPHSTLNEKLTSANCGSNPVSDSVTSKISLVAVDASFTRRKRYGEKSPHELVRTTRIFAALGSAVKYALSAGVACGGGAEAGAIHAAGIPVTLSPPTISTLFGVNAVGAAFRQYTSSVLWRKLPSAIAA